MNSATKLSQFWTLLLPTPLQAVISFVLSLVVILVVQKQALTQHFGGGQIFEPATSRQINLQVANILGLSIVGQVAIIFFWAIVGLIAYLLVWLLHNALISARNEVIITTSYTNKKGSRFNFIGLLTKLASAIAVIFSITIIPFGLNFWLSLWQELLRTEFSIIASSFAFLSIIGFAAELYISFLLFQVMINRFRA